jgi:hypothetical protein
VRGDQVFGECFCATIDDITSTDDSFPNEDFFLDISSLYIDDMADDANANLNANANANLNANANPPAAPYAIYFYLTIPCTSVWNRCDLFIYVRCDLFVYSASMYD